MLQCIPTQNNNKKNQEPYHTSRILLLPHCCKLPLSLTAVHCNASLTGLPAFTSILEQPTLIVYKVGLPKHNKIKSDHASIQNSICHNSPFHSEVKVKALVMASKVLSDLSHPLHGVPEFISC
jgi:hypothetical protein